MNDKIDEYLSQEEHDKNLEMVNAIIEKCLAEGVLTDFLTSRREEVQAILTNRFDKETIVRNQIEQREAEKKHSHNGRGSSSGVSKP